MALVNIVNKDVKLDLPSIIKFQLINHCFIHGIILSELDLDCLTTLAILGETELTEFCSTMAERRLTEKLKTWEQEPTTRRPEASPQTIRNVLIKVEKENLLMKTGKSRKKISLNPDLKIQAGGNILLNFKVYCLES